MTNEADMSFMIAMGIGSNAQQLQLIPNNGSFAVVLASTVCTTSACGQHTLFDYDEPTVETAAGGLG